MENTLIPQHSNRIDFLQAISQPQLLQRSNTTRLQKLTNDAVRFLQGAFKEGDRAALAGEGDGEGGAEDAGADY